MPIGIRLEGCIPCFGRLHSLRDVLALTDKDIFNEVSISDGTYYINIDKEGGHGLLIKDKTSLRIDGHLIMRPNTFLAYNIIEVIGDEVIISGSGALQGDKFSHQGTEGEWGMGILVRGSKDVSISNLTIKDCWGDCIYVGFNAENILIDKCTLDHGRRQGISVTGGTNIIISGCNITNINGTPPEYGIDIEPNKGEVVGSVIITGCSISNSYGGIKCWGGARGASIKSIDISYCKVVDCEADHPIIFEVADTLYLKDSYIEADFSSPVYLSQIKNVFINSIETKAVCLRPIHKIDCKNIEINKVKNSFF